MIYSHYICLLTSKNHCQKGTQILALIFTGSRLKRFNALLSGALQKPCLDSKLFKKAAAEVLTTRTRAHITLVLKFIHLYPIHFRIVFRSVKSINRFAPKYTCEVLMRYAITVYLPECSGYRLDHCT